HTDLGNPAADELAEDASADLQASDDAGDAFDGVETVAPAQHPNPEGVHEGRRSAAGGTYGDFNRAGEGTRQHAPSEAYYDSNGAVDVSGTMPAVEGAGDTTAVSSTAQGRSGPPPYPITPGLDTADSVPERTDLPRNTNFQDS
ncbi:MAG: hypothetical protein JWQ11_3099, partial [Rhizobacter sp.]|nr:hypothetical protein [Rhizobacter sp.]